MAAPTPAPLTEDQLRLRMIAQAYVPLKDQTLTANLDVHTLANLNGLFVALDDNWEYLAEVLEHGL